MKLAFIDVDEGSASLLEDVDFLPSKSSRLTWTRPAAHGGDIAVGEYIVLAVTYEVGKDGLTALAHLRNSRLITPLREQ